MPMLFKRNIALSLLILGAAAFLVQCAPSEATSRHANGLTCQSYTTSSTGGVGVTTGTDCRFKCPDGRLLSLPEAVVSQSKDELNFLFCGVPLPSPTPAANAAQT